MLSDVAELVMGQSPPSTSYNDESGYGLPFYQGKTDFGATYPTPRIYCREPKKLAEAGDILMSVRAPVGATNICHGKSCIGRGIAAIRPKGIDRDFLYFYLKKIEAYVDSLGSGAIFKAINKSQLAELPINEAGIPLPEQKKIAHVLSTVQRAIEAQERIIQTTTELKKTLMHKLFTEGTRGEPQKQTEIGLIPESWEVIPLSKCAFVQTGIAKGRKISPGEGIELPYLRVANVQDGYLDLAEMKAITIGKKEQQRYVLQDGDIVLTEGGDFDKLGRGFIWHGQIENCVHQNHIFAVRPDASRLSNEFFAYQSQSPYGKRYFLSVAHKTTNLACINTTKLKAFPVLLPNPNEQQEIIKVCRSIDDKISLAQSKKVSIQDLFRTLLHELMTAKIRVDGIRLPKAQ